MEPNQDKKGEMESILAELGRSMDTLFQKARHASGDLQQEFSEKLKDLNKSKDRLERELKDFTQDEAKWKEVQARLHAAAHEIRQAIELSFKRKGKP